MNVENNKQLDSYSMLIVSKYFKCTQDYINTICVCKKFKETTEKLRYNPISITSLKLFPNIQTQCLYDENDSKIKGIDNYEIYYTVNYEQYLEYKETNIKNHQIIYTKQNVLKYGKIIPNEITIIGDYCYGSTSLFAIDVCDVKEITIPTKIKSLSDGCFDNCNSLSSITLPFSLTSLNALCFCNCWSLKSIILPSSLKVLCKYCFNNCTSLTSINLPSLIQLLGNGCFRNCNSLRSINVPPTITSLGEECFSYCKSLSLINLPTTLTSLSNSCFYYCHSLTSINLPSSIQSLGDICFNNCTALTSISLPSSVTSLGDYCFSYCLNLESVDGVNHLKIGKKCFLNCYKLKNKPSTYCVIN